MTTANILSQLGSPGVSTGFKNRIINGGMVIDQRNAGASVTPATNDYTLDRWNSRNSVTSKYSVQQNAGSVTPPAGFKNYLGATSLAATTVGSTDFYLLRQAIEGFNLADLGWGTANAKTVTLSFWVRSSLTGTFGGSLKNASDDRSYPFSYSIPVANTWTTISVTIAGDTTGTWLTTNGVGVWINFGLGVASTYSGTAGSWAAANYLSATGATSVVGTNGATFYITGVQLEVGTTATNFEVRSYGTELALCQRYFYMVTTGTGLPVMMGCYYSLTQIRGMLSFPVTMRSTPSLYASSGAGYYSFESTLGDDFNSFTIYRPNVNNSVLYNSTESSGTTGVAATVVTQNASAYVGFSAEL